MPVTKKIAHKISDAERRSALSLKLNAILLYGTFGLLLFGPVAFGSVEPWSMFVLEVGSVFLTLLWLAKQWNDGALDIRWNPLYLPMSAFGVLILYQIIFRTSAYPHDTVSGALLYGAYGMLCFLAGQVLLRSAQARTLAATFAVYGFAIAAFGLVYSVSSNGRLYWFYPLLNGGSIYGPYVNHNHYAGLMELLVPIPLVLSLTRLAEDNVRIACGVAAAVMVGTIFLSGSRGGMLAIFVELAVLGTLLLRQKKSFRIAAAMGAFAIVLVIILTWLGGKQVTSRVATISTETRTELSGGTRLTIDRDGLRMFRQKPVAGWGLRTFPVVYPQFRTFYTDFRINEAHNDYVQLLVETGILGFATMLWFVIVLYRTALRKVGNWMSEMTGAVTLACMLGFTGILVHSFFDFNLQIPANAALFYVFCTLAAAPPLLQRSRKRRPASTEADEVFPASEVV